jgi:hypothetical protein
MVTEIGTRDGREPPAARATVDPRAPRFGQAITATGLLLGVVLDVPVLVYAVAVVLVIAVATRWQLDLYGRLFKHVVRPTLAPAEPESAVPHRFAKLIGAVGTTLASLALVLGHPVLGYGIGVLVAAAAGLAATTGFCIGCRMYRQVSLFRRLSLV